MTENQNPEQKARDSIDALLQQAGWQVQHKKKIDLNVGLGQAVREAISRETSKARSKAGGSQTASTEEIWYQEN